MIETLIAAYCAAFTDPVSSCETELYDLRDTYAKHGETSETFESSLKILLSDRLQKTSAGLHTARLVIDTESGEPTTVFIFNDAGVLPSDNPPAPNLTCTTPCDILVTNLQPKGFAFYLENSVYWTPALFANAMSVAMEDGVPTYRADIDMETQYYNSVSWRMEQAMDPDRSERCDREAWARSKTRDAEVCKRFPPVMPRLVERSGHCNVAFDIDRSGRVRDPNAVFCTDGAFRKPSEYALSRWSYLPAKKNGFAVAAENQLTKMSFRLTDENGDIIPEEDAD